MSEEASVSWSGLTSWRAECHQRFGALHDFPVVDISKELRRLTGEASFLLDVGAGRDHPLTRQVDMTGIDYRSLDTDPDGEFDFTDVAEIPPDLRFDLAVANQVLEHVSVDHALEIVRGVARVLAPGGRFAATVPNASHPVRQWADATHVTAWGVFDFYGLFRTCGLEVELIGRYGKKRLPIHPWRRLLVKTVAREFRVDWCDSILVVSKRPL